jgi:hypothetical protein
MTTDNDPIFNPEVNNTTLFDRCENNLPLYKALSTISRGFIELRQTVQGHRDTLIEHLLSCFDKQPINIAIVGATEELNLNYRIHSGWMEVLFAMYLKVYGGHMTVMDLNPYHVENTAMLVHCLGDLDIQYGVGRAEGFDFSVKKWDIVYLDGGNLPVETRIQFDNAQPHSRMIIIDDYDIKGIYINKVTRFPILEGVGVWSEEFDEQVKNLAGESLQ